ncbi:RluA family pseudouridine synthase [uncultured Brevibacillus sp.]|uniref:RluA family pseudouridine synthase n=1 Tax=uncultured Brevibacillus sp. TaxID=169970 RepID=UPI0025913B1E|nr:RluA family pseudouridine synthase [uncultured Brevibacillus sp.]
MSSKNWMEYTVTEEDVGMNVEQIVRQKMNVSGRMMQRLTRSKGILLNRKQPFLQRQVKTGDQIAVRVVDRQPLQDKAPVEAKRSVTPESIPPIEILYEDDHLLIVNKPAGMMVHPIKQEQSGTLVHVLADLFLAKGVQLNPHPVHRLDKETSGAILLAKSSYGHQLADRLLREGGIHREYLAIVNGVVEDEAGTIDAPIGRDPKHPTRRRVVDTGDHAVTHYEVTKRTSQMSLVRVWLETGRTHQIRVHFAHLGHPLAGDTMYGAARGLMRRQALHASSLRFEHPIRKEEIAAHAPLPADMKRLIQAEFQ